MPRLHLHREWVAHATSAPGLGLTRATSGPGLGSSLRHPHPWGSPLPHRAGVGSPVPHLHRDCCHRCRICTGGLGSPLPHLHRDSAHRCHICTGTGAHPCCIAPGWARHDVPVCFLAAGSAPSCADSSTPNRHPCRCVLPLTTSLAPSSVVAFALTLCSDGLRLIVRAAACGSCRFAASCF
jgi:hypothetical protein